MAFVDSLAAAQKLVKELADEIDRMGDDHDDDDADDLRQENDELRDRLRKLLNDGVTIESLMYRDGKLDVALAGGLAQVVAFSMVEMYRKEGGTNYVEMQLQDPNTRERFTVTVQRINGNTPHELKAAAEHRLDRAVTQLRRDAQGLTNLMELDLIPRSHFPDTQRELIALTGVIQEVASGAVTPRP